MVEVKGDLSNLQLSVDFYLRVISKDSVADSKTMRDRFFSMFKEEDSFRDDNYIAHQERILNDYIIDTDVEPELFGEESVFDSNVNYFGASDSSSLEKESSKLEIEKPNYMLFENTLENENTYSENEDNDFITQNYNDEEVSEEDDDFINWGSDEVIDEDEEYSSWSNMDDEEVIEDETLEDNSYDEFSSWGSSDEEDEKIAEENSYDEFSYWGNDDEVEDKVNDSVTSKDDGWDLDAFDDSFDFEEEKVPEVKVQTVSKIVAKDDQVVTGIPKDLRDFVKMYPNCEMSFALKYFSKKEIDKQLNLGRVFKRKNRLLI